MRTTMLQTAAVATLALLIGAGLDGAAAQGRTTLDIYVVDVEGGNATLFVPPSGESLLIDTGNYGPEASVRDATRIIDGHKGRRPHADRSSDHHPLARRPFRRHGRGRQAHPDQAFHRSRGEPAARSARRRIPGQGLSPPDCQREAHRCEAGRQDRGRGPRRARGRLERRDHQDAPPRRRRAEPLLREFQARRQQHRGPVVGRRPHHVREIPHHASR